MTYLGLCSVLPALKGQELYHPPLCWARVLGLLWQEVLAFGLLGAPEKLGVQLALPFHSSFGNVFFTPHGSWL